jgi:oligopeptide/dipeptide ABC transporter ATP-binding protein
VSEEVLKVEDLRVYFPHKSRGVFPRTIGQIKAVDGVSFELGGAETLGLVGESGCGKSTTGRAILRLVDPTSGHVIINGTDVAGLSRRAMRPVRQQAQMIFQDPYNALNPRQTVGAILGSPFRIQKVEPAGGVKQAVRELMDRVGLNPEHVNRYPYEFSGGQRQRIGIARAIALRPKLIICDEPVSALDVSIQAQILNLLQDLQSDFGVSYLFIAHDLAVVRQIAQRVAVMYLGHIVENAPREELFAHPLHPYTHALMSAVPVPDPRVQMERERIVLGGDLPSPLNPPSGCVFHTRCFIAQERCRTEKPELREFAPGHTVACHFPITEPLSGGIIHGPDSGLVAPDEGEPGYFSETITDLGGVGTTRLDSANPGEGI